MSGGDWKEMLVAVQDGNLDLVKYHLKEGIDVNYEHPELMTTALIESINFERLEIARFLLANGADPTQKAWISTDDPLKMARKKGNKELIKLIKSHLPKKRNAFARLLKLWGLHACFHYGISNRYFSYI